MYEAHSPTILSDMQIASIVLKIRFTRSLTGFAEKDCGRREPSRYRIVGGAKAGLGSSPWIALLMHARRKHPGYEPACGGALITAKVVLTAAHCVEIGPNETASKKLRVRLGEHDTSTTSESPHGHVDLVPDRVIAHEGYDASLVKNDIALVVLRGRAPLGKGIGTACLPSEDGGASRLNGKAALVAGWGATSSGGNMSRVLRETTVPILAHEDCAKSYQGLLDIDENHLCAGTSAGDRDACKVRESD
ncbi:unnamed protein product [Ixodes persulcatus]